MNGPLIWLAAAGPMNDSSLVLLIGLFVLFAAVTALIVWRELRP